MVYRLAVRLVPTDSQPKSRIHHRPMYSHDAVNSTLFLPFFGLFCSTGLGFLELVFCSQIVPNFTWLNPIFSSIVTMIDYMVNRKDYLTFFTDWALLENQLDFNQIDKERRGKIRRNSKFVCLFYL